MNPADIIEVYTDADGAKTTATEWRDSQRVLRVRTVKRTVRAHGATSTVWVVCTWYTDIAKAQGWCT